MSRELTQLLRGRSGHFQMESGYHSRVWYDLASLFSGTTDLRPHVQALAQRLERHRPEAICGPVVGGAKLAAAVAAELGVSACFAERFEPPSAKGLFPIRYTVPVGQREVLRGRRVALVDDAISAGSAIRGTHGDLVALGARPVALGAFFVFGTAADEFAQGEGLIVEALARPPYQLWHPASCPLCAAGVPFEKVSDATPPPAA